MFLGTSIHNMDQKGRVILPSKFREELGDTFYVTGGFNRCVQILSSAQFELLRDQIRKLPVAKALSLQYLLIANAAQVSPNAQGRIMIPQKLREDAGLSKDVVVVGMDTRIEIWSKDIYEPFIQKEKEDNIEDALELLSFGG